MKSNCTLSAPSGMLKCGATMLSALLVLGTIPQSAIAQSTTAAAPSAKTPIQHVVIIIGENRTFDHVYGTYVPRSGQSVWNLWSKRIVNADGSPGANFKLSQQYSAVDNTTYSNSPKGKSLYKTLPPSLTGGAPTKGTTYGGPFLSQAVGQVADPDLASGYNKYLTTGATGLPGGAVDTRITSTNPAAPRNGVYQLTGPKMSYDTYTSSPVHRLFQMWQQTDCNKSKATAANPSGCQNDLFPWVEVTIGAGSNGATQADNFNNKSTGEGSTAMAFYNMQRGDVPYFKSLADDYTISDNFHQSVMGGTGANHIMFGYGDMIYYSDGKGNATKPPASEIEDTDPESGTNNYYSEDGYGTFDADGNPMGGGSYVDCTDMSEGGVPAISNYLESMEIPARCQAGHYYLVNNYNPGYLGNGTVAPLTGTGGYPFTIPPTSVPSIGDTMMAANLSFKYFGEGWNIYAADPTGSDPWDTYCNICNPFGYQTSIMANPTNREAHIGDVDELYEDIDAGLLPAVSVIKPSGYNDGHPASSKLDLFEGFTKKIVSAIQSNKKLWSSTAIFITFDEGGGYYDSGYIQPVDFFGDGTRIPLIVVSPYSQGGIVNHSYSDHVSLIKFIEKNWGLKPITARSRDNFPNPKVNSKVSIYVPTNSPAIDDLMGAFSFKSKVTDERGGQN